MYKRNFSEAFGLHSEQWWNMSHLIISSRNGQIILFFRISPTSLVDLDRRTCLACLLLIVERTLLLPCPRLFSIFSFSFLGQIYLLDGNDELRR